MTQEELHEFTLALQAAATRWINANNDGTKKVTGSAIGARDNNCVFGYDIDGQIVTIGVKIET